MANLNEVIETLGFGMFSVKLFLLLGLWWMVDGLEITLMSLLTPYLRCNLGVTLNQAALVSSVVMAGTAIGALYWGRMSDRFGRRVMFTTAVLMALYFGLLSALADTYAWLLAIRGFVGIAVGGIALSPLYIIEYYPREYRARMAILVQFFFVTGNLYAMLVGYLTLNAYGYQIFLLLVTIPLPITYASTYYLPESLHYLQNIGDFNGIVRILKRISLEQNVELPREIELKKGTEVQGDFRLLLTKKHLRTTLLLALVWICMMSLYYCNVLLNVEIYTLRYCDYAVTNVTANGQCHNLTNSEYVQSCLVIISEIPGCMVYFCFIDRIGRKPCLVAGFVVNLLGFLALNFCMPEMLRAAVLTIMRATIGPCSVVLFIYTLELYPTTIRSTAVGICGSAGRWVSIITPFIVQSVLHYSLLLTTIILIIACALAIVCVMLIKTETMGRFLKNK